MSILSARPKAMELHRSRGSTSAIQCDPIQTIAQIKRHHDIVLSMDDHDGLPELQDMNIRLKSQPIGVHWLRDGKIEPGQILIEFGKRMHAYLVPNVGERAFEDHSPGSPFP